MAGNDDRNWVRSVGQADSAAGIRISDAAGNFAIGNRLAVGNATEFVPDLLLKRRAFRSKRQIEILQLSCKIRTQLPHDFGEAARVFLPISLGSCWPAVSGKLDFLQTRAIAHEQQRTNWRRRMRVQGAHTRLR